MVMARTVFCRITPTNDGRGKTFAQPSKEEIARNPSERLATDWPRVETILRFFHHDAFIGTPDSAYG